MNYNSTIFNEKKIINYMKYFFLVTFLFLFQICLSQKENNFDFDKLKVSLIKENLPEANKIKNWLLKSMTKDEKLICTKKCSEYLSDIPDDIELGNEINPGTIKKVFYKKWALTHDMYRIPPVHPFELGNGGCNKSYAMNSNFIGTKSDEYYFNVIIYCDKITRNNNKLILKVITENDKYKIDDVLSQNKSDYFEGY